MTKINNTGLLMKAIENLPNNTYLHYVSQGDGFDAEKCNEIAGGNKDKVIENMAFDDDYETITNYLEDALKGEDSETIKEFRQSEEFDEFLQACYDRDDSDLYAETLSQTDRQLIKFYIRNTAGERIALADGSWRWSSEYTESEAKLLCKACKLDWTVNRNAFIELVANATQGGILCLMAYVDMSDVDKWVEHCLTGDERGRMALTFQNPHVLIHDWFSGSGHDVRVVGDVSVRFGRGALDTVRGIMEVDAKGLNGYSWDETCGLHKPAYKTEIKAKPYKATKGQKLDKKAPEAWPGM